MRALHLATRLAGTDGVSLEATKVARVLAEHGFERLDCAGEVETPGAIEIPAMHFRSPEALELGARAFASDEPDPTLEVTIEESAERLSVRLLEVVRTSAPDLLVIQNAWAIPMQLPLAGALARVVDATGLPTLSHEHDYPWERVRFARNRIGGYLERYFPYDAVQVRHLAISSLAAKGLHDHRRLDATVVPNVMDFGGSMPAARDRERIRHEVRDALRLERDRRMILQPTRVVDRKGIELAIEVLARLDDPRNVLVISHESGDEGQATLARLRAQAAANHVDLRHAGRRFAPRRTEDRFSLADAYDAADFVTYPSLYEGFGNALIETMLHRRAALVNRYPVYASDIAPTGVDFVEVDGVVDDAAVERVATLLNDPAARAEMTDHNFEIGAKFFGMPALRAALEGPLRSLGVAAT